MDESRRLAMRRAHAGRASHCTCGKTVHGNGGEHAHRAMHERRGEWRTAGGHYYMTYSEYLRRKADAGPPVMPKDGPPPEAFKAYAEQLNADAKAFVRSQKKNR